MPVLYERVFNVGASNANLTKWTASATISITSYEVTLVDGAKYTLYVDNTNKYFLYNASNNPVTVTNNQFTVDGVTYTISIDNETGVPSVTGDSEVTVEPTGETTYTFPVGNNTYTITVAGTVGAYTYIVYDNSDTPVPVDENTVEVDGVTYTISISETGVPSVTGGSEVDVEETETNTYSFPVGSVYYTIAVTEGDGAYTYTVSDNQHNPVTVTNNQFTVDGVTYTISIDNETGVPSVTGDSSIEVTETDTDRYKFHVGDTTYYYIAVAENQGTYSYTVSNNQHNPVSVDTEGKFTVGYVTYTVTFNSENGEFSIKKSQSCGVGTASKLIEFKIKSTQVGRIGTSVSYTFSKIPNKSVYNLTVTRESGNGFSYVSATTYLTTDRALVTDDCWLFDDTSLNGVKDKSGLVEFTGGDWKVPTTNVNTFETESNTLTLGSDVVATADEFTLSDMYAVLPNLFDKLSDRGTYVIRFISSGAYPTIRTIAESATTKMLKVATARGECTALIDDIYQGEVVDPTNSESTYAVIKDFMERISDVDRINPVTKETVDNYGSAFIPYARYKCDTVYNAITGNAYIFDTYASFGYLYAYAQAVKAGNPEYLAMAGFERGVLPNCVVLLQPITDAVANAIQPTDDYSINAICNVKPRGIMVWGNRTLKDNSVKHELTHQSFLNIRQACSPIKRQVIYACKSLTFEQNTDVLFANFKAKITPLLDRMVSGGGIGDYQILRIKTTKKATVKAKIIITPIEPVEDWDITLELSDTVSTAVEA